MILVDPSSLVAAELLVNPRHEVLQPAGPQAAHIETLFWIIFWICLAVFILMNLVLWWGGRKNIVTRADSRDVIENEEGDRRAMWGVSAAVVVTTITLFVVLVMSIKAGHFVQQTYAQNPVTINVTGHQWWWEVIYPNSESYLQITTANEIHVPIRERIAVVTRSADVIHSFWAPNVTGKRDLVPGYASSFTFEIDIPGVYRGQCAEFCGLQHAHMGFSIIAESREDFDAWQANQLLEASEPNDPRTLHGREVFLSHACVMCHTISGTDAGSRMGPDLTHLASRQQIAAGTLPNVPGALAGWILNPQSIKPGNHMAMNVLNGADLSDLLAYLASLK